MSNQKLFSVVFFDKEKKYSVVPTTWLGQGKKNCAWPGKKTKKCRSSAKRSHIHS
jgi:hypothetical protein